MSEQNAKKGGFKTRPPVEAPPLDVEALNARPLPLSQMEPGLIARILALIPQMPWGGPQDIELPVESGMVDPRIPQTGSALLKAFRTTNAYAGERAGGTGAADALRKAGRR